MPADLTLICHASTAAVRSARFPADDPLDQEGMAQAVAAAAARRRADWVVLAPSVAAGQTASALGLDGTVEPLIRDCDFGRWAGRRLYEVARDESEAFTAWMTDPTAAPGDGEALADLLRRVGPWVDDCRRRSGRTIAVTHSAVIRAAIVFAIEANPATFWHLDVGPLSETRLRSNGGRWTLRTFGPREQDRSGPGHQATDFIQYLLATGA